MVGVGEPVALPIRRLGRARLTRWLMALSVVAGWLALFVADAIFSLMLFSGPHPEILLWTSPMLLAVPWILSGLGQGRLLVRPDALEVRYSRLLKRPLVIPRALVARVLLDDGSATGRARFATGDPAAPLLWTDPVPLRQRDDLPLIGDAELPNLAVVLHEPLPLAAFRGPPTAITATGEMPPPRPGREARGLVFAVEDLEAARLALAGWPVEQPDVAAVIPAEVADSAARVPGDAAVFVALACLGALTLVTSLYFLFPVWVGLSMWWAVVMVRRRQRAEAAARAAVGDRLMTPAERATATAAIDANFRSRVR
jgi:hypothetical protein